MANPEHLEILSKGVEVWNKWREENPDIRIDLSGVSLYNTNLRNANLRNANFSDAEIYKTDFSEANLKEVNFKDAYIASSDFKLANLEKVSFENFEFNLDKPNSFYKSNLRGAIFNINFLREYEVIFDLLHHEELNKSLKPIELRGIILKEENDEYQEGLEGFDLIDFHLTEINLSHFNLKRVQAYGTNFENSTLTGACIEDWGINSKTNLTNIKCDYIYLKHTGIKGQFKERRPSDINKIFELGDFERLVRKSQETIDLIFRNGIDWKAFLDSYESLQAEAGGNIFPIRRIDNQSDGSFVIRLEVPPELNKAKIQKSIETKYKRVLKRRVQQYRKELNWKDEQIEFYKEQNTNLLEIVKIKANQPVNMTQNIQGDWIMSGNNYTQSGNFGIGHMSGGEIKESAKIAGVINEVGQKQSLAEAAREIQQLLDQLSETYSPEEAEQMVAKDLANKAKQDPSFKEKLKNWSLSITGKGAETAVLESIKEGVKRVIPLAITLLV